MFLSPGSTVYGLRCDTKGKHDLSGHSFTYWTCGIAVRGLLREMLEPNRMSILYNRYSFSEYFLYDYQWSRLMLAEACNFSAEPVTFWGYWPGGQVWYLEIILLALVFIGFSSLVRKDWLAPPALASSVIQVFIYLRSNYLCVVMARFRYALLNWLLHFFMIW